MLKMRSAYKRVYNFENRRYCAEQLRKEKPKFIPAIVELPTKSGIKAMPVCLSSSTTFGYWQKWFKRKNGLRPQDVLVLLVDNVIELVPTSCSNMLSLYESYRDEDQFLYIFCYDENVYDCLSSVPCKEKKKSKH